MFNYLDNYPQYNGHYTRPCKVYDLGLTPKQEQEFYNFLQDDVDGLATFWEENSTLAKDIYQEGRSGGHLIFDKDVYINHIDVDSAAELIDLEIEEDGLVDDNEILEKVEEIKERIKNEYEDLIDFDHRVDKLIMNLKATLDARIENKHLDEAVDTKSSLFIDAINEFADEYDIDLDNLKPGQDITYEASDYYRSAVGDLLEFGKE